MNAQPERYSEELLVDLVTTVEQALADDGIDKHTARKAALEAAESLRVRWGGQQLYFPKGIRFELSQRDLDIFEEFNGHNHNELAKKYDVCMVRIYKIVKQVRRDQVRLRQADIFDDTAGKG